MLNASPVVQSRKSILSASDIKNKRAQDEMWRFKKATQELYRAMVLYQRVLVCSNVIENGWRWLSLPTKLRSEYVNPMHLFATDR